MQYYSTKALIKLHGYSETCFMYHDNHQLYHITIMGLPDRERGLVKLWYTYCVI